MKLHRRELYNQNEYYFCKSPLGNNYNHKIIWFFNILLM